MTTAKAGLPTVAGLVAVAEQVRADSAALATAAAAVVFAPAADV